MVVTRLLAQVFQKPKFRVGDAVYLISSDNRNREGLYIVASVISAAICTLSMENGDPLRNGEEIDTNYVEAV